MRIYQLDYTEPFPATHPNLELAFDSPSPLDEAKRFSFSGLDPPRESIGGMYRSSILGNGSFFGNPSQFYQFTDLPKTETEPFDENSDLGCKTTVTLVPNTRVVSKPKRKFDPSKENEDIKKPELHKSKSVLKAESVLEKMKAVQTKAKAEIKESEPKAPEIATGTCTCKKTKCLKLYCECFANGGICGPKCKCLDCHNKAELQDLRELIIQETLEKNPLAFTSKYKKTTDKTADKLHSRGCNCKKTGCVKNYCECYTEGLGCSKICKCSGCKNEHMELKDEEADLYREKILRKRKKPNYLYEFYFQKYDNLKRTHGEEKIV